MKKNTLDNNNGQFVLSYELLYLLQWLVEHESETIKKLIHKAIKQGYRQQADRTNDFVELQVSDAIQQSIVEFLGMMDAMLIDASQEQDVNKVLHHSLIPAIKHIDSSICDSNMVESSVEKATAHVKLHPEQNAQELLFKELLRRWKPHKKNGLN